MKSCFSLILVGLFSCLSFAQSKLLPAFTSISTGGSVSVELIKGETPKAEYIIQKGNKEDLYIEVKDGELTLKIKSKNNKWSRSETKATVKVYYQQLRKIDCASGSSISSFAEIDTPTMEIDASSGANCQIKISSNELKVNSSSGARIAISGTSKVAKYDASSGSRIDAASNQSESVNAEASSGANVLVYASKKITANASSGGIIKYKGNPENKNINTGMSGSVNPY